MWSIEELRVFFRISQNLGIFPEIRETGPAIADPAPGKVRPVWVKYAPCGPGARFRLTCTSIITAYRIPRINFPGKAGPVRGVTLKC
jgi:hypothetical protein